MTTNFEFRLIGADWPDGQIDADQLVAIVSSLQELVTRLGRVEVDAEPLGRPPKKVARVAKLRIGLAPGSTRILVERSVVEGALDFDLAEEQGVDERFQQIVESIARDERPAWVSDSIAESAADLTAALQKAAPVVEFKASGVTRAEFETLNTHRETWRAAPKPDDETVTVVGRLEAVDLKTHHLRVRDDVGNAFALPKVSSTEKVKHLIGSYVRVVGQADRDIRGRLSGVHYAEITATETWDDARVGEVVPLEQLLASAPGPSRGGIPGLTDDEADAFWEAIRR